MSRRAYASRRSAGQARALAAAQGNIPSPNPVLQRSARPYHVQLLPARPGEPSMMAIDVAPVSPAKKAKTDRWTCPDSPPVVPVDKNTDMEPWLQVLAPWVHRTLLSAIASRVPGIADFADVPPHGHAPLQAKDQPQTEGELSSYKTPWALARSAGLAWDDVSL